MYNQIGGSSNGQWSRSAEDDEHAYGDRFADTFAELRLGASDSNGYSSSSSARPYSVVSRPPVVEMTKAAFRQEAQAFHGPEIWHIANNPQEYSHFISDKARRTAEVAEEYGTTRDSDQARYFSYHLGSKSVGLLRMEGGDSMTEFDVERWQELFPGRTRTTSTVDLQVVHPLVENAGDILLEYQLGLDGKRPLLNLRPANDEARARAEKLGFVEVDDDNMVLDPTKSEKWTLSHGKWQRTGTSARYLSKTDEGEGRNAKPAASSSEYSDEDDFM